jgi:hypothetical protein
METKDEAFADFLTPEPLDLVVVKPVLVVTSLHIGFKDTLGNWPGVLELEVFQNKG